MMQYKKLLVYSFIVILIFVLDRLSKLYILNLAETSNAVILGFSVRATRKLYDEAVQRGVAIKYFSVIYELIDTVKELMAGALPPLSTEVVIGHAEVRNTIKVPKIGVVAGSAVTDGKVVRNSHLHIVRDGIVVYQGKIGSLRRFKEDVKEVQSGYECGIAMDDYNDFKEGDVLEFFNIEESPSVLDI